MLLRLLAFLGIIDDTSLSCWWVVNNFSHAHLPVKKLFKPSTNFGARDVYGPFTKGEAIIEAERLTRISHTNYYNKQKKPIH